MSDFIVLTPEKNSISAKKRFCYWTVADGKYAKMVENTIASARAVGVKEDFHVWTDQKIEGAITHECGNFDKHLYIFKFKFLKEHVQKLDYDYFIFLDADNIFVRNPGDILSVMGDSPVFACMENDCDPNRSKRREWWGCKIEFWTELLRMYGVKTPKIYNTNAGFWIVKKDYVDTFYDLGMKFWSDCHKNYGLTQFTEEPALAYVTHILAADYQDRYTLEKTSHIWASDWTGNFKNALPTGSPWQFEDYMSGEKKMVNPAIVHVMRSDDLMVAETEKRRARASVSPVDISKGFWMGHQMLGDVIGFCAAAHILHKKTGQIIKIHFPQEERMGITSYFTGVRWVKKEEIPNAINCGMDPTPEQWPTMNGVKRFYRFMDPTMKSTISFDVHMNIEKYVAPKEKLIGIVAHSVTQGSIPTNVVTQMCKDALEKFPGYKLVLLGEKKNTFTFPNDVVIEDRRDEAADYDSLIEQIRNLALLLCPQTGPCFIAAGLRVPMWVYRSKEVHWDYVLNYDKHKVEKWYDREKEKTFRDYSNFLLGCSGIGDMTCALNALESVGIENNKDVYVYVDKAKVEKLYNLHSLFSLNRVKITTEMPDKNVTVGANAHGMDCSWVYDWPAAWGVTKRLGDGYMMKPKHFSWRGKKGTVGVSFTVNFARHKNPSTGYKSSIVRSLLDSGNRVIYFGALDANDTESLWLREFSNKIQYAPKDLFQTADMLCNCEYFIGADSGMSWLSVFFKVPTTVVLGRTYGNELPKTFTKIKHCKMLWEDEVETVIKKKI